jgi:hypothetical protein
MLTTPVRDQVPPLLPFPAGSKVCALFDHGCVLDKGDDACADAHACSVRLGGMFAAIIEGTNKNQLTALPMASSLAFVCIRLSGGDSAIKITVPPKTMADRITIAKMAYPTESQRRWLV